MKGSLSLEEISQLSCRLLGKRRFYNASAADTTFSAVVLAVLIMCARSFSLRSAKKN